MDATSKELLSKVKIAARSRGLVLVPFGTAHCKAVVGRSDASLAAAEFATAAHTPERARASFRRAIKRQLAALQGAPGAGAFCGHSLTTDFKKLLLLGAADLYRSDTAMVLAFQMRPNAQAQAHAQGNANANANANAVEHALVGVASFGAADHEELTDGGARDTEVSGAVGAQIAEAIASAEDGRVLELDLVCVRGAAHATGALLTSFVLARELARTRARRPRYTSVITRLAIAAVPGAAAASAAAPVFPFAGVTTRLGFIDAELESDDGKYVILIGDAHGSDVRKRLVRFFDAAFPMGPLEQLCSVRARSGLGQCL